MSKYTFPDLTTGKILHKGKRYIAFEVGINNIYDEFEQEFDFIIWDGLYDAPLAYGTIDENGFYKGF